MLVLCTLALAFGRDEDGEPLALPHGDAMYYYVYLPSLWLDGDVDLANQYAVSGDPWQHRTTPVGRAGNVFGVGPAVFSSPLFLLGHGIARVSGGRDDGFSMLAIALTAWASTFASIAAIWFAFRLLARRLGDERRALVAALLAFAAGPVLYFAIRQPVMSHAFATLFAAWLIDAWDASYERERTLRTWLVLGALFGAMVLARPQLVTWGICVAAAAIDDVRRGDLARRVGRMAAGGVVAVVCVLPQLLVWRANYGAWFVVPQGDGFMRWDDPAWSETLFSSRNGLLPWSPLYAIALVGLFAALRKLPRLAGILLAGIAAQTLVNGAVWDWWAGGSLGARRFDSAYIAFALGLGVVLVAAGKRRATLWIAGVVCGWLALASVILTLMTTPHSMRQKGGEPAGDVIERELGAFGAPVAWLSSLTNLPARAVFALRHDTSLDVYDRVVGVHWLAETYPPLSTKTPRTNARRQVADIPAAFRDGLRGDVMVGERARVFIGLNLRAPVHVRVQAQGPVVLSWNGTAMSSPEFDALPERGTNELGIRAAPGTRVEWIELSTSLP